MAKWKINVDLTVFATVEAETKHDAYDAVTEEIKWLIQYRWRTQSIFTSAICTGKSCNCHISFIHFNLGLV